MTGDDFAHGLREALAAAQRARAALEAVELPPTVWVEKGLLQELLDLSIGNLDAAVEMWLSRVNRN